MYGGITMMTEKNLIKPPLKWAGGKRQLLSEIKKYIPESFETYYEPFLGGGAVLFDLQPEKAVVNDYNSDLMNVYETIRDNVEELIEYLEVHEANNSKEYYYEIRAWDREEGYAERSDVEKAARLIFMNKAGFNGLYRVNSKNQFNVPYGKYKNPAIVNTDVLYSLNEFFNTIDITMLNGDFVEAVSGAKSGDFVYFDPPYVPLNETSAFTSYTNNGFTKEDQIRLRELCDDLDSRGVKFLLSNSNVPFIQEQYEHYNIEIVGATRAINSNAKKRGKVEEVLIRNY